MAAASEALLSMNTASDAYNRKATVEVLLRGDTGFLPVQALQSYKLKHAMAQHHSARILGCCPTRWL